MSRRSLSHNQRTSLVLYDIDVSDEGLADAEVICHYITMTYRRNKIPVNIAVRNDNDMRVITHVQNIIQRHTWYSRANAIDPVSASVMANLHELYITLITEYPPSRVIYRHFRYALGLRAIWSHGICKLRAYAHKYRHSWELPLTNRICDIDATLVEGTYKSVICRKNMDRFTEELHEIYEIATGMSPSGPNSALVDAITAQMRIVDVDMDTLLRFVRLMSITFYSDYDVLFMGRSAQMLQEMRIELSGWLADNKARLYRNHIITIKYIIALINVYSKGTTSP